MIRVFHWSSLQQEIFINSCVIESLKVFQQDSSIFQFILQREANKHSAKVLLNCVL